MPTGSFYASERLAHICALQLSRPGGNSIIETGAGGLAPAFKPRFRLRQGIPLVVETVQVVGSSRGLNMTPR